MPVVVTGSAGFIGSHLVERLTASGEEEGVIDRREAGYSVPLAAKEVL